MWWLLVVPAALVVDWLIEQYESVSESERPDPPRSEGYRPRESNAPRLPPTQGSKGVPVKLDIHGAVDPPPARGLMRPVRRVPAPNPTRPNTRIM